MSSLTRNSRSAKRKLSSATHPRKLSFSNNFMVHHSLPPICTSNYDNSASTNIFFYTLSLDEIRIGDEITPTLLKAIQESRMAITVFSEEYASSTFCLDELVQIHQCINGNGRLVWPIFYNVEPSEVRHQRGKYGQALVTHEKNSRADEEKIKKWKHTLREVANLKGSSCDTRKDYERELIKDIVNRIVRIIKERDPLDVAEYPVGLTSRIEKINSLLQLGSNDKVFMVGICGTGGMGKTTIARAMYNVIAAHFDYFCFLDDIKGESTKHGLQQQQAKMLSKLLRQKIEIEDIDEGVECMKRTLKGKKTLLILDNVDERKQLQKLAGTCEWFGSGSRIIITTRDLHLLKFHGVERIYDMEVLNHEESLELLIWMAFRKKQVDYDPSYKDVVERVIRYARGLPLALELIGSDLYDKDVREWESMLNERKRTPHANIQQILKVSYDGLQQPEKEAFLDIACFYNGSGLEYVKKMVGILHGYDPADYHIGVLVDKCLIKIDNFSNSIKMHDLVQDMGREIIHQESRKDPRKRSRLWSSKDIRRVLEECEGTSDVIAIIQVESFESMEIDWDGNAFKSMKNLKILILENAIFLQGPEYLPNGLAILRWRGYPSSSLPDGFRPKSLVELDLGDSNFSNLSSIVASVREMTSQKAHVSVMKFWRCKYIEKIPNLSGFPSLKQLQLLFCTNLIEIDNSVGQLPKLETLNVSYCPQLRTFPSKLNTPSLYSLGLEKCRSLNFFPEIVTKEMKIDSLSLNETGIDQLPRSVENLTRLHWLTIKTNSRVKSMKLPSSTFLLPLLEFLTVEGFEEELIMEVESMIYPDIFSLALNNCNISNENLRICLVALSNVHILNLRGSHFTILPACIEDCRFLYALLLEKCKQLIEVEKVPPSIIVLSAGGCTSLSSESRKLLLSKELLASVVQINHEYPVLPTRVDFCVPGGSIPEWFDHCSKGPSISFWFLDQYFPPYLIICAIVEAKVDVMVKRKVFINEEACADQDTSVTLGYDEDHIIVNCIDRCEMKESYAQGQWKHAKICLSLEAKDVTVKENIRYLSSESKDATVKGSGIYVVRDERTNMKNIRFTDPFQCSYLLTNDQGCTIEGDTAATSNPFFLSRSERQHTHSHVVLDIDGLRRLSAVCWTERYTFPISIHMDARIVGSQLGYDFIITKQHIMEFLSMQELCITIIQVFIKFATWLCRHRKIDDRFGFLCPNVVQSVGNTREDRISYIGSTIKEGNKQCWLAPIHDGDHWTLCAICPKSNIIYWFDSLGKEQSDYIEKIFTEALEMYHIIGEKNTKWLRPNYRRQLGDKECGYYVMRYVYDIIDLNLVHSLDTHFNNPQCYSQEDIDNIRNMLSNFIYWRCVTSVGKHYKRRAFRQIVRHSMF
ncbi:hypothetical protein K1719_000284 [Acacia pycnantha]|nr:hypothetical protein K1719_000284 [Acacia pycnantha]